MSATQESLNSHGSKSTLMPVVSHLNGVIATLESGKQAFLRFSSGAQKGSDRQR